MENVLACMRLAACSVRCHGCKPIPIPLPYQVVVTGEAPIEEKAALLQPLRDLGTLQVCICLLLA